MTSPNLVWVDMEMTGLDVYNDKIMEVACLVTDKDLNVIDPGIQFVVHQPEEVLTTMDSWCIDHHGKTGLAEACRKSQLSIEQVEKELLAYLSRFSKPKESPLAGNSVYMDRMFMKREMPQLDDFLHYRLVDVSTIKELCRRWNPTVYAATPKKRLVHRALEDIQDSIAELKYYQTDLFNCTDGVKK